MLKEFQEFALKGNVLDMAVGIIIGAAFTTIVSSLVEDVIMPPISLILGGVDFSNWFIQLTGRDNVAATYAAAKEAGHVALGLGVFLNAVIKFVIVAFAVFMLVRQFNRLKAATTKPATAPAPAALPADVLLLTEIRDLLKAR